MRGDKRKSPALARWLFKCVARSEEKVTIYGDMEEYFQELVIERSILRARLWYWLQVLLAIPALILNSIKGSAMMIKNYFKTAVRNLLLHKGYSLINIAGLAIGMACCLLILMFVNNELSYDRYHENADRIYRVVSEIKFGGRHFKLAVLPPAAAGTFVKELPEVKDAVRFRNRGSYIIKFADKSFKENRLIFSEPSFFNIFSIPLLAGNVKTALKNPYSIVLSKRSAEKYFGQENPVGKILKLDNERDYRITGIYDNIPATSHFHFDFIASINSIEEFDVTDWLRDNFQTYLLLRENADAKALQAKFPQIIKKYFGVEIEKVTGKSLDEMIKSGYVSITYRMQPLTDIHLYSNLTAELEPNSDIKYVYIFSAIAFFILIIASINFMNLATARSAVRAREVGIRKVLGSERRQLVVQFLTESILLSLLSMVIALLLIHLLLPYFNQLSGKELAFADSYHFITLLSMFGITLFTGIIAGFYPAIIISSFRPVAVLKGQLRSGSKSTLMRRSLVVFQFSAAIVLIIGTLVVINQMNFIQSKKLGFNKEHVLILENAYLLENQAKAFKNEMLKNPHILRATISGYLPVPSIRSNNAIFPEGEIPDERSTSVQNWEIDYDYIDTMGMKIIAGRNFSKDFSTDTSAVIINQKLAKFFGWADPIGKRLGTLVSRKGETKIFTVIGVVEDFHFQSLRNNIEPLVLYLKDNKDLMSFRLKGENIAGVIHALRQAWDKFIPGQPFEYTFMDDSFKTVYQGELRLSKIFGIFATLAIFIGCLGLCGLAAFISEQRTKEIGIRKVLGATVAGIINLLSREFIILVGIANLVAWPIAYLIMDKWLQGFAYKASLSPWIFVISSILSLGIALLTTSFLAVKAAVADPVKSIKYE